VVELGVAHRGEERAAFIGGLGVWGDDGVTERSSAVLRRLEARAYGSDAADGPSVRGARAYGGAPARTRRITGRETRWGARDLGTEHLGEGAVLGGVAALWRRGVAGALFNTIFLKIFK
jgi:hypothetical protein